MNRLRQSTIQGHSWFFSPQMAVLDVGILVGFAIFRIFGQ